MFTTYSINIQYQNGRSVIVFTLSQIVSFDLEVNFLKIQESEFGQNMPNSSFLYEPVT